MEKSPSKNKSKSQGSPQPNEPEDHSKLKLPNYKETYARQKEWEIVFTEHVLVTGYTSYWTILEGRHHQIIIIF